MRRVVVGWDNGTGCLKHAAIPDRAIANKHFPFDNQVARKRDAILGEDLTTARVDDGTTAGERCKRRCPGDRYVEAEGEPTGDGKPNANRGEASRPNTHDDAVNVARLQARGTYEAVGRNEQRLRLGLALADHRTTVQERTGGDARGSVKREDRLHG